MSASLAPVEGTLVDDRYRLAGVLGEGSFGAVWRAEDTRLSNRSVAVKFLKPEFLSQPDLVARFDSEADALAHLQHPNVVAVIDRGGWRGQRFIVTEHVQGESLTAWIRARRSRREPPPFEEAIGLFDQLCAGIEAAHGVRAPGPIVHRDIKPDNVLVRTLGDGESVVKVLDFGIAQLGRRSGTQSGAMLGTPQYMAPEQAFGHSAGIGPWTDVFSLAVLLVEMLTLRAQPTVEEPWWGTALKRSRSELRAMLHEARDDVPAGVWEVVAEALSPHAPDRPQDAGALRARLRAAAPSPRAITAHTVVRASAAPSSRAPSAPKIPPSPRISHESLGMMDTLDNGPQRPSQRSSAPAHSVVRVSAEPATTTEPGSARKVPWGLVILGVTVGSVLLSGLLVALVVWSDGRAHPAPPPAPAPPSAPVRTP